MASVLVEDWTNLDTVQGAELEAGNGYKQFAVPTLTDDDKALIANVGINKVYIGVQAIEGNVYTFVSTKSIIDPEGFIATGEGTISDGEIKNIMLKLQPNATTKLGINNPYVTSVIGTASNDEIYVEGVSYNTTLDFGSGGKDTVKFVGESQVDTIIGGKGDNNKVSLVSGDENGLKVQVWGSSEGNVEILGGEHADSLSIPIACPL